MKRVLVIGSGGAGKSTVAAAISERLGLPLVALDKEYWQPGWVEPPKAEWEQAVQQLIEEEAWVMDGNYGSTLPQRLAAADAVVFLDRSRWLCLRRVVRRRLRFHNRTRPEMTPGCPERLTAPFLRWIWHYPATRRPGILAQLQALPAEKQVFVLRSEQAVRHFLADLSPRDK